MSCIIACYTEATIPMEQVVQAQPNWWQRFLAWVTNHPGQVSLVIVAVGFLVYLNALPNALFWDDDDGILHNIFIRDWSYLNSFFTQNLIAGSGLLSNYWRPLLLITYATEWHLWGAWAPGYHAVNIMLHLGAAVVLWEFLRKLTREPAVAFVATLVFALHPLQTEAVTYVSGRADPLAALLGFLALRQYFKHLELNAGKFWTKPYIWALAWFVLSLLTKEKAVALPALLLLVELFLWWRDKRILFWPSARAAILRLLPFAGIAAGYLWLRATVLNFNDTFNLYGEATQYTESLTTRLYTFFGVFATYLKLVLLPIGQHMERVAQVKLSFWDAEVIIGVVLMLSLVALAFWALQRKPLYALGVAWYLLTLLPASGVFVPVSALIWEHYLYLPLIGVGLMLGQALLDIVLRWRVFIYIGASLVVVWLGFLGVQTIRRNAIWRTPVSLYEDVVKYNQGSLRVWNNLGMAYVDAGKPTEAIRAYEQAIALDLRAQSAPPRHNLGNIYESLGKSDEAIKLYQAAISIDLKFIYSYQNLAALYVRQERYTDAILVLEQALVQLPDNPQLRSNLKAVQQAVVK